MPIESKPINLALQGGGAHGAFTWGVLDRLLEDERVRIEAISGTSAGAINAVVAADGMVKAGREGARQALWDFWRAVSQAALFSPLQGNWAEELAGNWNLDSAPGYLIFDLISRMLSPYDVNPLNLNPLRELLSEKIDFDNVRRCDRLKLFVSATRVSNGRIRIFNNAELSADAVMASACLPHLFQAVEIDGEAYWDGGYMGNPALYPFAYRCTSQDVVIVQINPLCCQETPRSARDILNRVNEITFNSSLMKELRAIDFVTRLLDDERLDPQHYKRLLIHMIEAQAELQRHNASSKLNADWRFLRRLYAVGRKVTTTWLDRTADQLGKASSVDLRALFA